MIIKTAAELKHVIENYEADKDGVQTIDHLAEFQRELPEMILKLDIKTLI